MYAQIRQVCLTYLTQRYLWLIVAFLGLAALPNLLAAAMSRGASSSAVMFSLGMPMLMLLPFLVGQAKMQFAHSRAKLIPSFMPAHLAVLGGILVTAFGIVPLLIARLSHIGPLGPLAMAVAIGVPAVWGAQLNRFLPMLISMVAFYSLMTESGLRWWLTDAAAHQFAHTMIVMGGLALLAAWLWRICHMHEELPDYQNAYQAVLARRTGSEAIEQRRIVASALRRNKLTAQVSDWWHNRLGGYCGGSRPRLVRLLQYGYGPTPVVVNALFILAMMLTIGIFFSTFSYLADAQNFGSVWFLLVFAIGMPGQMAGELLAQRRARLATEMLLPLSRRQLIGGLFRAAAHNAVIVWLVMNLGLAVIAATMNASLTPRTIALYVLLSATAAVTAAGLSLRLAVWPSLFKRLSVQMGSWFVLFAPAVALWFTREKLGDVPLVIVAAVMLALGAGLVRHARRVWENVEFA